IQNQSNSKMASTSPSMEMNITHNNESHCDVYVYRDTAKIIFSVFYSILFVIGSCGNVLALYMSIQKKQKLNSTRLYLINLAISDALFTLALPGRITYYVLEFNWPFGDFFCRLTAFIFYVNTYVGMSFMTCLSVDRYVAVVHSYRLSKFRKVKTGKYICVFIWLLVLCETAPLLLRPMAKQMDDRVTCMEYFDFEKVPSLPIILLIACVFGYCIPMGITLFCYSQINLKLCKATKENPLTEKTGYTKKAITIIFLVLLAFMVCFSPYHINIMQFMVRKILYQPSCWDQKIFKLSLQITVSLMNINCCTDPVIYFFAFKGYKRKVLSFFRVNLSAPQSSTAKTYSESNSFSHNLVLASETQKAE
uniref:Si:ch211-184m13.4 n=1 Tax=Latimeria chalumnae TaxID=7897 RepID=H2ZV23_LATCH